MSKSRLISGKVKKLVGSELDSDRSSFLNLANAEPDLGLPNVDGSILVADIDGTRYWSPSIRADVTGNIFLGSINSADGSTAIRLTNSTIIEGDLTIDSVGNIPTLITSDIRSIDSSSIVIANSIIAQSNLEVQNDLTVNGNFTVLGSTTTINSTTLTVEDKNIELAKNSTSAATSDGAGITVVGPVTPATIAYDAATDTWNFNKTIVGTVQGATSIQDIDDRIDLFFDNDINTSDSSSIVFVPAVELRADLTVDNDVRVTNSVYADRFVGDGSQLTNLPTFSGYTGSAGFTGSQGDTGFVGSQGELGFTGSQGDIGYTGSQGNVGFTGSAGAAGGDGSVGFTGSRGDIGYTGSAGAAGGDGSVGFTGSQGDIGYTGSQGYTGSAGASGASVFTALTDTPADYTSQAGKIVLVKATEDGLEFGDAPTSGSTAPRFLSLIQEGNLRVLNGISRWYAPASVTITKIIARVDEAPTGNNLLLRVNKVSAGVTTSVNITITATTTKTENNSPNLTLAADDYLTVDVTQIGGTNPGKGLRVTFIYE
jgi:hypothetical protein